jgi:hypothetical protein
MFFSEAIYTGFLAALAVPFEEAWAKIGCGVMITAPMML